MITRSGAGLRVRAREREPLASTTGADVAALRRALDDATLVPLFGKNEERLRSNAARAASESGVSQPDLSVFYRVDAAPERVDDLAEQLREVDVVEAAYVKPPAEPPQQLNDMPPSDADAPPATPDFTASQVYLGAAPAGVEALWAHTRPGGKGNNIRIIDVEGAWRFSHEDLTQVQGGVVGGTQIANIDWRNHGTAVIGVFGGDENNIGIKGIAPNANTRAISIFLNAQGTSANSSKAIKDAADLLSAGDIILIELHRPGPRHNFQNRADQLGYIAVEWWEDDFQAIKYATSKGVIVVEAAGNGAENLDDALYNVRPAGFPATWTNPFNRANRDSGAILVGAGAPPPGTHGRDHGPDRSRLEFSNYGASLDVQGWGREVTTSGYGNLQGGGDEDLWYTDTFSGTSSSSPVVVGAVASMQGNRKATGQAVYTPAQVRQRLRTTGSAQQDAPGRPATQRIGTRPNLKQLIGGIKAIKEVIKDVKIEKLEKLEKNEKAEKIEKIEVKDKNDIKDQKHEKVEKPEKLEKIEKAEKIEKPEKLEVIEKDPIEKGHEKFEEVQFGGQQIGPAAGGLAEGVPAPLPSVCTLFGNMPVGLGPNPLMGNQASFLVRQFNGVPAPNTHIVNQNSPNGVFHGLDCGFNCEITINGLASAVSLVLVHFAQPATIGAFNAAGALVGTAVMTPQQAVAQTLAITAPNIRRVVIRCPQDETLLLRFCWKPIIKKIEKQEKPEIKEIKEHKEIIKETKEFKEIKEKEKDKDKEKEKEKEKDKDKDKDKEQKESPKELKDLAKEKETIKEKEAIKEKETLKNEKEGLKEKEQGPKEIIEGPSGQSAHFIGSAFRPDLSGGALTGEEDLGGAAALSEQLQKDATDAKAAKDNKDVEKLSEQ